MAIDLTPEQRETGTANYVRTAEGLTRRGFLKSMAVAGAAAVPVSAAVYFGYESLHGRPVKAALIGGGDEGGVLVGEHNPEYLEFVAVCDIRPSNMKRIFDGEPAGLRKGFKKVYGKNAESQIRKYADYKEMLKNEKEIEAVVIATPLCWHAKMAIDAMKIGKERGRPIHVLCEKLMGWNVSQCKAMIAAAEETGSILSVGHQRHYSMLYAHAVEILKNDVLGDIKYIRALWHRNNAWPFKPTDEQKAKMVKEVVQPFYRDGWFNPVLHEDYDALNAKVRDYQFDDMEQLIRWRCHNATGGGLMAELGSHQLDACSIFLGHVQPLAVSGVGGKYFYGRRPASGETNDYGFQTNYNDRDCDDQVFLTYEFPGPNHPRGRNRGTDEGDLVVVTYTSINTNQFETYGECVKGHARHDDRGPRVVGAAVPGEEPLRRRPGRRAGHHGDGRCGRQGQAGAGHVLDVGGGGERRHAGRGADGRQSRRRRQPRLPRGDGGLRLLRPPLGRERRLRQGRRQVQATAAQVPRRGGDGGCDHRADGQPGDGRPSADRVQGRLVRREIGGGPRRRHETENPGVRSATV